MISRMKDWISHYNILKQMRADIAASAILCIAIGVIIILWPMQTLLLLCYTLALLFLIMGLSMLLAYFTNEKKQQFRLACGVILSILGAFIMIRPTAILQIVSIVIGVVIVIHGIKDMFLVMEGKEYEEKRWWLPSLLATITLMFGSYLIWDYFNASEIFIWFLGVALIYDGLSDLIILAKIKMAQRAARQATEAVDIEFKEKEV